MTTVIVDYNSGNLRSAEKSFQRAGQDLDETILVSSRPEAIEAADRIVLPGVGAFEDCRNALRGEAGLFDAIHERVQSGVPFLGICVGMQMVASYGVENGTHEGFDWIKGQVEALCLDDPDLKVPHIGWNELTIARAHPLFEGIAPQSHFYFVHSFHMKCQSDENILARCDYGGEVAAVVGKDNILGTQFHPEKSQEAGLRLIQNFMKWRP